MELIQNKDINSFINNKKCENNNFNNKFTSKENNTFSNTNFNSSTNNNINNSEPNYIAILDKKFGLIKKLGEGSTAKVYLCYPLKDTNLEKKLYSIKILKQEKFNEEMFNLETSLLSSINNENVLHIYAHGKGKKVKANDKIKEVYYIVMEFMQHGNLLQYITNISSKPGENIGFGEVYSRLIFSQLLDGLEAIHNSDGVHRDIKPNNIMIGNDYKLKIVDLGFATKKSNNFLKQYLGTPTYVAPEIHLRKPYLGEFSDIFSLGVTLFILVTGSLPFRLPVPNDMMYQFFVRNDYVGFWRQRKIRVSVSFMQLFDNLVAFDYTQRPSISEIRKSKWMQETDYSLLPKLNEELKRREFIINQKLNKCNQINRQLNNNTNKGNNTNMKINRGLIEIGKVKRDEEIYNCHNIIEDKLIQNNNDPNKINININNNINKEMIIEKDEDLINISTLTILKSVENIKKNKENEYQGGMFIIVESNNLNEIMNEICKYLKYKGFNNVLKNANELSIFVKKDNFDVGLFFHNYKRNIIKINYLKQKGKSNDFEQFKKIIKNIKFQKKK